MPWKIPRMGAFQNLKMLFDISYHLFQTIMIRIIPMKLTLRMVLWSVFVAYFLFPLIYIKDHWFNLLTQNYRGESYNYESFWPYLDRITTGALFFATLIMFASLLPCQLFKNYYLYKTEKNFYFKSLMVYILINILFVCITGYGSFLLMPLAPIYSKVPFLITLIVASIIVHGLLYLAVDRHYREEVI